MTDSVRITDPLFLSNEMFMAIGSNEVLFELHRELLIKLEKQEREQAKYDKWFNLVRKIGRSVVSRVGTKYARAMSLFGVRMAKRTPTRVLRRSVTRMAKRTSVKMTVMFIKWLLVNSKTFISRHLSYLTVLNGYDEVMLDRAFRKGIMDCLEKMTPRNTLVYPFRILSHFLEFIWNGI